MAPRAHAAHHSHPANALGEKFTHAFKVGNRRNGAGQQFYFVSLLGDQTTEQEIVARAIFEYLEAAEACDTLLGGHHCGSEREMNTVELPGHEYPGVKVRDHADRLQFFHERAIPRRDIEASDAADARIGERSDDTAQVAGVDANVGVVDDEGVVLRFALHQTQLGNLVVQRVVTCAVEQSNFTIGKVPHQFADHRDGRISLVGDAKDQFVLGIVLAAKTGEAFVSVGIEAAHGLEIADGRCEIGAILGREFRLRKITARAVKDNQIKDKRNSRREKQDQLKNSWVHGTSIETLRRNLPPLDTSTGSGALFERR